MSGDILETAKSIGDLRMFVQSVEAAGLTDTLKSQGPFTVFAPRDEAFRNLPIGTLEGIQKDLPRLKSVLNYHIVSRKIAVKDLHDMTTDGRITEVTTAQGSAVKLKTHQQAFLRSEYVNDAKIVKSDIKTSNGVIHVIDRVLMPSV
jgi:uncharacterized surface protein with fasciclin (FAS1) repeats